MEEDRFTIELRRTVAGEGHEWRPVVFVRMILGSDDVLFNIVRNQKNYPTRGEALAAAYKAIDLHVAANG